MKKIAILFLSLLFLVSCGNKPQDKAEKGVKDFLKKNVQLYEPISFGKLDTLVLDNDAAYIVAKDSLSFYMNALKETGDQFKLASNQQNAKRMKDEVDAVKTFYEGKKYRINHVYNANTSQGKKDEVNKDFYMDSMYNVVE
ncbi:MAG: hypothetical protein ACK5KP_09340 [Paludibacteraceae bacterium]